MQVAIITGSIAPLRKEKSGASEMVSELLFGESVEILESDNTWVKVRNLSDSYEGWMDCRLLEELPDQNPDILQKGKLIHSVIYPVYRLDPNYGMRIQLLGYNSFFPDCLRTSSNENSIQYRFGKTEFMVGPDGLDACIPFTEADLLEISERYLNTPYLWGGRSASGIDCSGLTQQVYRVFGKNIPRDARDQAKIGKRTNWEEIRPGDLAFFSNSEGKIIHTGICLEDHEIIHASGFVKIDELRPEGIFDKQLQKITHTLSFINSYFSDY
jgi:gamma-D-glutamyl-L-lysine dipeptidyl-peptidase